MIKEWNKPDKTKYARMVIDGWNFRIISYTMKGSDIYDFIVPEDYLVYLNYIGDVFDVHLVTDDEHYEHIGQFKLIHSVAMDDVKIGGITMERV